MFYTPSFSLEFNQIYTSVTVFFFCSLCFYFEIHPHCCFQWHFIHFHQILVRQFQTYLFYTRLKFGLFSFYFRITNDTDLYFLLEFWCPWPREGLQCISIRAKLLGNKYIYRFNFPVFQDNIKLLYETVLGVHTLSIIYKNLFCLTSSPLDIF